MDDLIYMLFVALSDFNAKKFVENIGYGYASGWMASHQSQFHHEDPDQQQVLEEVTEMRPDINPVTGQRRDMEPYTGGLFDNMSEEEKMREAEKMFVLFER